MKHKSDFWKNFGDRLSWSYGDGKESHNKVMECHIACGAEGKAVYTMAPTSFMWYCDGHGVRLRRDKTYYVMDQFSLVSRLPNGTYRKKSIDPAQSASIPLYTATPREHVAFLKRRRKSILFQVKDGLEGKKAPIPLYGPLLGSTVIPGDKVDGRSVRTCRGGVGVDFRRLTGFRLGGTLLPKDGQTGGLGITPTGMCDVLPGYYIIGGRWLRTPELQLDISGDLIIWQPEEHHPYPKSEDFIQIDGITVDWRIVAGKTTACALAQERVFEIGKLAGVVTKLGRPRKASKTDTAQPDLFRDAAVGGKPEEPQELNFPVDVSASLSKPQLENMVKYLPKVEQSLELAELRSKVSAMKGEIAVLQDRMACLETQAAWQLHNQLEAARILAKSSFDPGMEIILEARR